MKKEIHPVCEEARNFYYDFIMNEPGIPAEIREHMEACCLCREELGRLRTELGSGGSPFFSLTTDLLGVQMLLFDRWAGCVQVKPFLAVFSASGCMPKVPTPVTTHLAHCAACREDLSAVCSLGLSRAQTVLAGRYLAGDEAAESQLAPEQMPVLRRIRQRPSSGIWTRIRRDEKTGRFAVSVGTQPAVLEASRPSPSVWHPARWARGGLTAAAVLLIAALFLWRAPSVTGLDVAEVYQALGNVLNVAITSYGSPPGENVKITSYALEEAEPLQQIWISGAFDIQLYIEKDRVVLWDLSHQRKIIKTPSGLEITAIPYTVKELEVPWGLLPFRNLAELPAGYRWRDVQDPSLEKEPDTMVYDLTWTQPLSAGREMERKWRGYLNAYTKRPYRIEWWDKLPGQDFRKMTTTLVAYPEDEEVLERIRAEGFDYSPGDQI